MISLEGLNQKYVFAESFLGVNPGNEKESLVRTIQDGVGHPTRCMGSCQVRTGNPLGKSINKYVLKSSPNSVLKFVQKSFQKSNYQSVWKSVKKSIQKSVQKSV